VHGDFFPFGVKDYRLRRLARTSRAPIRFAVGTFRAVLFNLALLAVLVTAYLIWLAATPRVPDLVPRATHDAVALVLALLLIAATILIAIEAVYGYAVLGSYGLGFHELRPERRVPERALVREFQVFAGALIAAHLAGVGAMFLIGHRFGGYRKFTMDTPDAAQAVLQTLDCAYYTLAVFVGAGDPEPLTAAGKLASGLVAVQGLAFLVLVLASMLSIVGNERRRPPATLPREPAPEPGPPAPPASTSAGAGPGGARSFALGAAVGAAGALGVLAWLAARRGRRRGHD